MEVVEEDEDDMKSYEISLTDPLEDMHNEEPVEENEEVEKLVEALDKVTV